MCDNLLKLRLAHVSLSVPIACIHASCSVDLCLLQTGLHGRFELSISSGATGAATESCRHTTGSLICILSLNVLWLRLRSTQQEICSLFDVAIARHESILRHLLGKAKRHEVLQGICPLLRICALTHYFTLKFIYS